MQNMQGKSQMHIEFQNMKKNLNQFITKYHLQQKNGDYGITLDYYDKLIPDGLLDELMKKGFTITVYTGSQKDPCNYIKISW